MHLVVTSSGLLRACLVSAIECCQEDIKHADGTPASGFCSDSCCTSNASIPTVSICRVWTFTPLGSWLSYCLCREALYPLWSVAYFIEFQPTSRHGIFLFYGLSSNFLLLFTKTLGICIESTYWPRIWSTFKILTREKKFHAFSIFEKDFNLNFNRIIIFKQSSVIFLSTQDHDF